MINNDNRQYMMNMYCGSTEYMSTFCKEFTDFIDEETEIHNFPRSVQFSSVTQPCPILCDPMTAALQASLSITNSQSLLKLMSIQSMMPSNHLILCRPLLLPPSIFSSIRVFSNKSVLHIRWPKYWGFSFSISPSSEYPGLILKD